MNGSYWIESQNIEIPTDQLEQNRILHEMFRRKIGHIQYSRWAVQKSRFSRQRWKVGNVILLGYFLSAMGSNVTVAKIFKTVDLKKQWTYFKEKHLEAPLISLTYQCEEWRTVKINVGDGILFILCNILTGDHVWEAWY